MHIYDTVRVPYSEMRKFSWKYLNGLILYAIICSFCREEARLSLCTYLVKGYLTHGENVQCWHAISSSGDLFLFWNFTMENKKKNNKK